MDELVAALERASRRRAAGPAAAVAAVAIAGAIWSSRAATPSSPMIAPVAACGKRAQIAAVWNARARDTYLATERFRYRAEEAGWFDWYARELETAYAASCARGEARRIACLDEAVDDLRAATGRVDRLNWPSLRAIDRCGRPLREVDLGGGAQIDCPRLSLDGTQIVLDRGGTNFLRNLGSGELQPIDLVPPFSWQADGSIAGVDAQHRIAVFDPLTRRTRQTFELAGELIDVAADLSHAAVVVDGQLAIVPLAGEAPRDKPSAISPLSEHLGSFSPDGQRLAWLTVDAVTAWWLRIDDLGDRTHDSIRMRISGGPIGSTVYWIDPVTVVVSGSASDTPSSDLWRVHVDPGRGVRQPPQILRHMEAFDGMLVCDARADKLLVRHIHLEPSNFVIDRGVRVPLSSAGVVMGLRAVDRARQRVLVSPDLGSTQWSWMSFDGMHVEPVPALEGLSFAAPYASEIAALDLRNETPVYVAFDGAGREQIRIPIEAARGTMPQMHCAARGCVVKWEAEDGGVIVTIEGHEIGRPVHLEGREFSARLTWELSDDGRQLVVSRGAEILIYDLMASTLRRVPVAGAAFVQWAAFSPDGTIVLSAVASDPATGQFLVARLDAAGRAQPLWRGAAWVSGLKALDDHRVIVATTAFPTRLKLLRDSP
jgi:hypothetical protein